MTLDQLAQFFEAGRHEHFGKAARFLHISPGAISHSVAALEEEFSKKLFVKLGKQVRLTDHGKLLMEKAEHLLREASAVRETLAADDSSLRGHYRIAGTQLLSASMLLPAWAELQSLHPEISGEIFSRRSSEVLAGVVQGEFDYGICFSPQAHPDVSSQLLHTGTLQVVVRADHPLAATTPKTWLRRLREYPATLPKAFHGVDVCEKHPVFEKFGLVVKKPRCLFDSYDLAIAMVARSDSWTFIPDVLVQQDNRISVLRSPKGWDAYYDISAVWPRRNDLGRVLSQLTASIGVAKKGFTKSTP